MHCDAGLDTLISGTAWIGDTELGTLGDRQLTLLRRQRVGFVLQSCNLLPTLTVARGRGPGRPAAAPPERALRGPPVLAGWRPARRAWTY